jgi:hypothetical protein
MALALLLIRIVAVVIERWVGDVIGCGGEAGMPTRVATRGVGAVGGMLGWLRVGASRHAAEHGLQKEETWRRGVNGQTGAE